MSAIDVENRFLKQLDKILAVDNARLQVQQLAPKIHNNRNLAVSQPDALAKLEFAGKSAQVVIEFKSSGNPASIRQASEQLKSYAKAFNALPMLVAPYLSPRARQMLRDNDILYIDLSGNEWIKFEGLYIDVQGQANQFKEERISRDPFADKASLVLRAMFEQPQKQWGIHELANKLGITAGFVSKIINSINQRGYASKSEEGISLINPKSVLEDWVHAYSYKKNYQHNYFYPAPSAKSIIDVLKRLDGGKDIEYALALQAGAYLVAPYAEFDSVHVYAKDSDARERLVNLLGLRRVDRGSNFVILDPYYKQSVFYGKREESGLPVVSDLQLYIDLYNYPLRGLEQAEHIYVKRLAKIAGER
ncbi:MAG: type IV toxin-antitoxin system AbiEi family antitoxin [Candidatus Aquicultor sp.]